jgi:glycogen operon protein
VEPWEEDAHILLNMTDRPRNFPLPGIAGRDWHRAIDTALAAPGDVQMPNRQTPLDASSYKVSARCVLVFEARQGCAGAGYGTR